mmetsp:Transcript_129164/g.414040  ORF Transcript_129164/g.414040 Transcript_129164/m.414040 type:complete len:207 (+) Transcript_129164:126-746(+)
MPDSLQRLQHARLPPNSPKEAVRPQPQSFDKRSIIPSSLQEPQRSLTFPGRPQRALQGLRLLRPSPDGPGFDLVEQATHCARSPTRWAFDYNVRNIASTRALLLGDAIHHSRLCTLPATDTLRLAKHLGEAVRRDRFATTTHLAPSLSVRILGRACSLHTTFANKSLQVSPLLPRACCRNIRTNPLLEGAPKRSDVLQSTLHFCIA